MPTEDDREYVVYVHIFPNGKRYVGITCRPVERRWESGAGYAKQLFMKRAIDKYGWSNIDHVILQKDLTIEEAERLEVDLIKQWKTREPLHGYNVDNGGITCGKHSESTKEKISKNRTGKCVGEENIRFGVDISGCKNPFYGKKHTEETRKKMREHKRDIEGSKNPWARKVKCGGLEFGSVKDCAEYYRINRDVMSGYLSGRRKISQRFADMNLCYVGER